MTWLLLVAAAAAPGDMAVIEGGTYAPLYPPDPDEPEVAVAGFAIDQSPVTRRRFAAFLAEHPRWRRDRVATLYADEGYLADWAAPDDPGGNLDQPVTRVSWFAARAYCEAQGRRLPTEDEWEYVARASETARDASDDPEWLGRILAWYGRPATDPLPDVGQGTPNVWGVHDLHGVAWEWVEDYNNTVFGDDAREGGDDERLRFCGVGALSATDVRDYARFMRIAFRSSLEGRYTTARLGFRCASDL